MLFYLFAMKNMDSPLAKPMASDTDLCLVDSATTHTILKRKRYFAHLIMEQGNVNTISGSTRLIEGSGRAEFILPGGTRLSIVNALYSPKSQRNLLSFKDIRINGYHVETTSETTKEGSIELLYITNTIAGKKCVVEKLPAFSSGLYYTYIGTNESHAVVNQKFTDHGNFVVWHDRLGHPGSIMMRKIIDNSCGHSLKN